MVKRAGKMLTVIGVLLLFLVYLFPRLAGFRVYSVISGSMEPGIPVGSLVYARKTEPEKLKEGEIIVYSRGSLRVVHRVIGQAKGKEQLFT